jgi:hypothetical protein
MGLTPAHLARQASAAASIPAVSRRFADPISRRDFGDSEGRGPTSGGQMERIGADHDRPAESIVGLAARRERLWGLIGGAVGASFGVGAALIAMLIEGAPAYSSGLYPEFFSRMRLLAFDAFLLLGLIVGLAFMGAALVFARVGRYPRTDCFGAGLLGTILSALGGLLIFLRLVAVIRGG